MSISTWTTVCQNFKSKFVKLMGAWPIWRWDIILAGPARTSWRMRTGGMPHGELHNPEGLFFSWFTTRRWMLFRKFSSTIGQEAVFWRCACKGTSRALWAVAVTPLQQYYFVRTYCCCERHASTSYKQVFMCSKTHSKVLLLDGGFFRDVPRRTRCKRDFFT